MILRGSDVRYCQSTEGNEAALYVNGVLRVAGTAEDIVHYLLISSEISFQKISLSDEILETFDGILPQKFSELDEVIEDRKNCELFND